MKTAFLGSLALGVVAALCGCGASPEGNSVLDDSAADPARGARLAEFRKSVAEAGGRSGGAQCRPGAPAGFLLPAPPEPAAPGPAGTTKATAQAAGPAPARKLAIRPAETPQWQASLADVGAVLSSAAGELWRYFPERDLPPIVVEPKGGPITLFQRGQNGEYVVRLDTGQLFWCQYAYQFAHEFCHILCNFRDGDKANKWFEESLCELASVFAIRGMARTWQTNPPYPNWRDFSKSLQSYADDLVKQGQLPQGASLPDWLKQNLGALANKADLRDRNRVVAVALLPLFEKAPEHWEAVQHLNAGDTGSTRSFQVYLADWCDQAPRRHKGFIRDIARQFAIQLPGQPEAPTPPQEPTR